FSYPPSPKSRTIKRSFFFREPVSRLKLSNSGYHRPQFSSHQRRREGGVIHPHVPEPISRSIITFASTRGKTDRRLIDSVHQSSLSWCRLRIIPIVSSVNGALVSVPMRLQLEELRVFPALSHQLIMAAFFD